MIGYFVAVCFFLFSVLQIFTLRLVADFAISGFVFEIDPMSFDNSSFPNEYVDLERKG